MTRKHLFVWAFWLAFFAGCTREAPSPREEPPPEDWLKRRELAARAAEIEAVLDQALITVGRDDAGAYLLVKDARADLLSAARRTADPEKRRILLEAHRDLEPVEVFLEGAGELNPPLSESDEDWLRESIVAVRLSLAPVSNGYADKLYGRYRAPRAPAPGGVTGPVPPEKRKLPGPPPEPTGPEAPLEEEPPGLPADTLAEEEPEPSPADEGE